MHYTQYIHEQLELFTFIVYLSSVDYISITMYDDIYILYLYLL